MTDIADDCVVLHLTHVVYGDDVGVTRRSDEQIGISDNLIERKHLQALHCGLQRVDRIDLSNEHSATLATQRLSTALTNIAVPANDRNLAAQHDVGSTADRVDQRVAAAVKVVELRFRDRVVHIDRREQQRVVLSHLVKPLHTCGGLFGDTLDELRHTRPLCWVRFKRALQQPQDDCEFRVIRFGRVRHLPGCFELNTLVKQ